MDRTYRWNGIKLVLSTWIQRRCKKCQRFLSKEQLEYCSKCSDKMYPYGNSLRWRVRNNADKFNVGDLV